MDIYVTSGVQTIAPRLGLQLGLGLGFVLGGQFFSEAIVLEPLHRYA